ncbi:MAG TPA: hypothetical protein VEY71_03850, partial [Chitinophagales bacterium]|nr:hypothetical protein [Chitinophagales bacterium]
KNARIIFLDLHQNIEEYSDTAVTKILEEKNFEYLAYPPNSGFSEKEKQELNKLNNNEELKNALRKVIADAASGVLFEFLNTIDGTGDPKNDDEGQWSTVKLIDEDWEEENEAVDEMLHDMFNETYWDWKERRGNKAWKLDTLEE